MKLALTLKNACALYLSSMLLKPYKIVHNYFIKSERKKSNVIYRVNRNI